MGRELVWGTILDSFSNHKLRGEYDGVFKCYLLKKQIGPFHTQPSESVYNEHEIVLPST